MFEKKQLIPALQQLVVVTYRASLANMTSDCNSIVWTIRDEHSYNWIWSHRQVRIFELGECFLETQKYV